MVQHNSTEAELRNKLEANELDWEAGRRSFLKTLGMAAGVAALGVPAMSESAEAQAVSDADILNFALNLEYLEAEFYLRAAYGDGLDFADTTGVGTRGDVVGGKTVPFVTPAIRNYAKEIANDERKHVLFLRSALGSAKVARPKINLRASFTAAAQAAGLIDNSSTFSPFDNETAFLIGAFIFEDVGVTAYKGAARRLDNKDYLEAAAGILAVEAYHAGMIRTIMYSKSMFKAAKAVSNLRDSVDGAADKDQGIGDKDRSNIVLADENGIAFSRSAEQVLKIVYLGSSDPGGFFPNGLNGAIK